MIVLWSIARASPEMTTTAGGIFHNCDGNNIEFCVAAKLHNNEQSSKLVDRSVNQRDAIAVCSGSSHKINLEFFKRRVPSYL